MVMDTLAVAVSASANYLLRHRETARSLLPLVAFPICGLADLFGIYHELKAVQLRTLNRERAELAAERWVDTDEVRRQPRHGARPLTPWQVGGPSLWSVQRALRCPRLYLGPCDVFG